MTEAEWMLGRMQAGAVYVVDDARLEVWVVDAAQHFAAFATDDEWYVAMELVEDGCARYRNLRDSDVQVIMVDGAPVMESLRRWRRETGRTVPRSGAALLADHLRF